MKVIIILYLWMYCDIDIIIIIKVTITLKSENSLTPVCMAKPLEAPATRRETNYWAPCLLVVLYI